MPGPASCGKWTFDVEDVLLPILVAGALFAVWWHSHGVSYVLTLRHEQRQWNFTIGSGQFRLHARRFPVHEPGRRVRLWRTRGPMFSPGRAPMDHSYWSLGNFCYVRGQNTDSGVRYRVVSMPILFPAVLAQIVAAVNQALLTA